MRRVLIPVAAALAVLSACAGPGGPVRVSGSDTVDDRYSVSGGRFTTGGDLVVMLRAFEEEGRVGVCGAFTWTRQSAVSLVHNNFVQNIGVVAIGGVPLLQGVGRFPEHPAKDDMTGVTARCFLTDVPWRPDFEVAPVHARFARVPFGDRDGGLWGGGVLTVFRSTPVPDLIARP